MPDSSRRLPKHKTALRLQPPQFLILWYTRRYTVGSESPVTHSQHSHLVVLKRAASHAVTPFSSEFAWEKRQSCCEKSQHCCELAPPVLEVSLASRVNHNPFSSSERVNFAKCHPSG